MSMTVITLQNSTAALRGDLSKWMQEIATGVYVGNLNAKVRESLWKRVKDSVGLGQATLTHYSRCELGYKIYTYNSKRTIIDYDGLQLVNFPSVTHSKKVDGIKKDFSLAAEYRKANKFHNVENSYLPNSPTVDCVFIDIETEGFNEEVDRIIEIAAIKLSGNNLSEFSRLINIGRELKSGIASLTGINTEMLKCEGVMISEALSEFIRFIGDKPLVGFNVNFDIRFIDQELSRVNMKALRNTHYDLLSYIKKDKMFLKSYSLDNVLEVYGIKTEVRHRALIDARLVSNLSRKVNGFLSMMKK